VPAILTMTCCPLWMRGFAVRVEPLESRVMVGMVL